MFKLRREVYFHKIEACIYIIRMLMLISSLKIKGHTYLHPIFVAACGVVQSSCSVFKSMSGKTNVFKLTIEDI